MLSQWFEQIGSLEYFKSYWSVTMNKSQFMLSVALIILLVQGCCHEFKVILSHRLTSDEQ
jgi:hypothetical protein